MLLHRGPGAGELFLDHLPVFLEHGPDEDPREFLALGVGGLGKLLVEDLGDHRLEARACAAPFRVAALAGLPASRLQLFGALGQ